MTDDFSAEEIADVAELIATLVNGGKSVLGAIATLKYHPEELLKLGRKAYERELGIIEAKDPAGIKHPSVQGWYVPPKKGKNWTAVKGYLTETLPAAAVDDVDTTTTKVVSFGSPPGRSPIDTRGLVLGYVQSGKTTNFLSVIAKAADIGYRLVIVLTGITENLRCQTQDRVDQALVETTDAVWHRLTSTDHDFSETTKADALLGKTDLRLIAVVKKNPSRLRRLRDWIRDAPKSVKDNCPILVIDDEADQASVDTGIKRRSAINSLILDILSNEKAQYIAYTATPFANLLIDTNNTHDLYPRTFIVPMNEPDGYFGSRALFGAPTLGEHGEDVDGFDLVRVISDFEAAAMKPPAGEAGLGWVPEPRPAIRRSVSWFLMATAARRARGVHSHSSMLVHTTMKSDAHFALQKLCRKVLHGISDGIKAKDPGLLEELAGLWEAEADRVPAAQFGNTPVTFDEVLANLPQVASETEVLVDNYLSKDRLNYRDDEPRTVIVVGGNTMSRGLTLEGLTCSYFVRSASAYDTLLQMGRWFGFRRGYEDLVRVWITQELRSWFRDLSGVELQIREEIAAYEANKMTPAELPVRIQTHPAMTITSAAKMRHAVPSTVSYSERFVQTIQFHQHDAAWLKGNIAAVRQLVTDAFANGVTQETTARGTRVLLGVGVEAIQGFLAAYQTTDGAITFDTGALAKYIENETAAGGLLSWNVAFVEPQGVPVSDLDVGFGGLRLGRRSRVKDGDGTIANLKAITSTEDRIRDMDVSVDEIKAFYHLPAKSRLTDGQLLEARTGPFREAGLLCLYPIAKDSKPSGGGKERAALDALEHLMGAAMYFPRAKHPDNRVPAMQANLVPVELEDIEDEIEAADEFDAEEEAQP